MPDSIRNVWGNWSDQIRTGFGERAVSVILALVVQGLFILLLLTLGSTIITRKEPDITVFAMSPVGEPRPDDDEQPAPPEPATNDAQPVKQPEEQPPEPVTAPPEPVKQETAPVPPAFLQLPRDQMASAEKAAPPALPAQPPKPVRVYGPPDTGTPSDTPRVSGTGPKGEPLYAASWYREPYDDELRGYLSTTQGPGWALIACRTVPDFRVEDCVRVDEYPSNAGIANAVLAAAWQFRVRPPRIGGRSKVGEWVRIRIDYSIRRN